MRAHLKHKEAFSQSTDESTVITDAFSGKPARGIKSFFISEMDKYTGDIPAYPIPKRTDSRYPTGCRKAGKNGVDVAVSGTGFTIGDDRIRVFCYSES